MSLWRSCGLRKPVRALARPHICVAPRRHASSQAKPSEANPVLAQVQRQQEERQRALPNKSRGIDPLPAQGNLAPNSIFSQDADIMAAVKARDAAAPRPIQERNMAAIYTKTDPNPLQRRRWERKMVIRSIQKRGRLTKDQVIKRTERRSLAKSDWWKTSMKKLQPLATQIAGKTIEDAITQMEFSKKKVAQNVKEHLEEARDRAIVERGMGLGKAEGKTGPQTVIRLKDDKRHVVKDQTGIYVAEAWVGKGTYGRMANPRARGRVDVLRLPQTSLTVVLKEEKTRIREHKERVERWKNRTIWTALKDRPINGQRPYYSW